MIPHEFVVGYLVLTVGAAAEIAVAFWLAPLIRNRLNLTRRLRDLKSWKSGVHAGRFIQRPRLSQRELGR